MKLTSYFIKKKVQHLSSAPTTRKHEFCTLKEAGHILVLYHAEDSKEVEPCLETLRMLHKEVHTCVYVQGNTIPEIDESCILIQESKDLDTWYIPKEDSVDKLKAVKADILIDLTRTDCYPMQCLMLQHPCCFKVGMKHEGVDLYDLSISVTEHKDIKHLFGHILFYLQTIRSK